MDRQLPCGFCSDKGREKLSPEKKDTSLFVRRLSGHTRRRHIMGSRGERPELWGLFEPLGAYYSKLRGMYLMNY